MAGPSIRFGHLAQDRRPDDPRATPLELVRRAAPISEGEAVSRLMKFLFSYEQVRRPLESLSGGEWTRLQLLLLMLRGANCLLLDEPTNHLDIESVEMLEGALETFDGHRGLRLARPLLPRPDRRPDPRGRATATCARTRAAGRSGGTPPPVPQLRPSRRSRAPSGGANRGKRCSEPARSRVDRGSRRPPPRRSPAARRASRIATEIAFAPSRREVGSSASSSRGRTTSARAIATRPARPARAGDTLGRPLAEADRLERRERRCGCRSSRPRSESASSTFSSADRCGTSPACCPT